MNTLAQVVPQDTSDSFQSNNNASIVVHKDVTDINNFIVFILFLFLSVNFNMKEMIKIICKNTYLIKIAYQISFVCCNIWFFDCVRSWFFDSNRRSAISSRNSISKGNVFSISISIFKSNFSRKKM